MKACIMDFDGLILDTETVWYDIFAKWLMEHHNYRLTVEKFLICVGSHSDALFDDLEKNHGTVVDRAAFARQTKKQFEETVANMPARDGVPEFIEAVKREGLKLALATSSTLPKPRFHLSRLRLIDKFDAMVTADDVKRIKPHPDLFLLALQKLGVTREEVVVIEDSQNGLAAGKNAGLPVIVVPNPVTANSDFAGAYKKVASMRELCIKTLKKEWEKC